MPELGAYDVKISVRNPPPDVLAFEGELKDLLWLPPFCILCVGKDPTSEHASKYINTDTRTRTHTRTRMSIRVNMHTRTHTHTNTRTRAQAQAQA